MGTDVELDAVDNDGHTAIYYCNQRGFTHAANKILSKMMPNMDHILNGTDKKIHANNKFVSFNLMIVFILLFYK